jgi:hypothetical protein
VPHLNDHLTQNDLLLVAIQPSKHLLCWDGRMKHSILGLMLLDCSERNRQREVIALADVVTRRGISHALYALSSVHVGIIAHMLATVQAL